MKSRHRTRLPVVLSLVAGLAALSLASGASAGDGAARGTFPTERILMKRDGSRLFFQPRTGDIDSGGTLTVKNRTNPNQVGPHTFSLVTKNRIPDSAQERNNCFDAGHICRKIANWHGGVAGPLVNPVDVAMPGWDRMGNLNRRGDSWLSQTQNETFSQAVSASAGDRLFFMCAVHPNMRGKLRVR